MSEKKIKRYKALLGYGFHIWLLIFVVNVIILYTTHFTIIGATCLTTQQVATDSRCLYIWGNKIYQKGSRSSPHNGHPCGTNITSVIPQSHISTQAKYLLPNYVGDICTNTPTPTNRPANTPTPTLKPASTLTPTPRTIPIIPPTGIVPTKTPLPTTPPPTNATLLNFTVFLHGIGKGGDSSKPGSNGNMNPVNPQRKISVELITSNNLIARVVTGTITYNQSTGAFNGIINLGTGVPTAQYSLRIKIPQFLRKLLPGIQNLRGGTTNNILPVTLIGGDVSGDNIISILDYNILMDCYSDLRPATSCEDQAKKASADISDDGSVNQFDYNFYIREQGNRLGD